MSYEAEQKLKQQLRTAVRKRLKTTLRGEVLGRPVQTRPRNTVTSERNNQTTASRFPWLYQRFVKGEA